MLINMSRSRKKNPVCGYVAESDKKWKTESNKKLRRKVKSDPEENADLRLKDVSNVYASNKDGKGRFDPEKYPKGMRK